MPRTPDKHNSAVEAVNTIAIGDDGLGGPTFPETVSYHKDVDKARKQHERFSQPLRAAARRVAVATSKRDEARAERKRLGDELLEARNKLAQVEARVAMGEGDETELRKAETLLAKLETSIRGKRDRLNRLAFSLDAEAREGVQTYVKAKNEEACARWVLARVRLEEVLRQLQELAAEADSLQRDLQAARMEAVHSNSEGQARVAPSIASRVFANRAIKEAVRHAEANAR